MNDAISGKKVLITGACGTVGKELAFQVLSRKPTELRLIDNNESEIFFLENRLSTWGTTALNPKTKIITSIGDIRDADKLYAATKDIDTIFHVAALKHVILCEKSPFDAVQSNILGVKNIINAALVNKAERVLFTSSDKAVNPTNVMGTTKLMGERLFTAANSLQDVGRTIFSSTRFGNVLASRGSVVPIFAKQILNGEPVTITDNKMTRFVMTKKESCALVLKAADLAKGGEVFVTKMPVMRIRDLAQAMANELSAMTGCPSKLTFEEIGAKPGEKLYEELMSEEESHRTVELTEMFSVLPAFRSVYEDITYEYPGLISSMVDEPYISSCENSMGIDQIQNYLRQNKLLDEYVTLYDEKTNHKPRLAA